MSPAPTTERLFTSSEGGEPFTFASFAESNADDGDLGAMLDTLSDLHIGNSATFGLGIDITRVS